MDHHDILLPHMTAERYERLVEVVGQRSRHLTVALENVYQPHNASAVMRSCDCFGIQDVHVIENSHKYKVSKQVALGSTKWLDLHRYNKEEYNSLECISTLKKQGYRVIGTSPHANDGSLEDLDVSLPTAIVFGTEGPGMTPEAISACDSVVKIPMFGFTESFNLSVSAAIVLHHLSWKLRSVEATWKLSETEQRAILTTWMKRSVRGSEKIIARHRSESDIKS